MVVVENPLNYKFIKFQKSTVKDKKYDAIIENKINGKLKKIPFGQKGYEQYKDSTGLGLYSDKDHLDEDRKKRYLKRHDKTKNNKFSSSYFSAKYLWT